MPTKDQLDEMIGAVAAEHGIVLDRTDPAAIIPTLVRLGIKRGVEELTDDREARRAELVAFLETARQSTVAALQKDLDAVVERIKGEIRLDLERASASAATLVANVNHANTRPMRLYWLTMGLLAACVLLGIGFGFGKYLR